MTRTPTHDDAQLILRLYDLRREGRMRQARRWFERSFVAETLEELSSLCPSGSEESASFRMVINYWDMVASFVTSGVLHRELFFESGYELLMVWERIKGLVPAMREKMHNPAVLRNLEEVGGAYLEWVEARAPDFYPAYAQAIRSMVVEDEGDEED